jgi:hypothetical protein
VSVNVAGTVINDEEYIRNGELQTTLLAVAQNLIQKSTAALSPAHVRRVDPTPAHDRQARLSGRLNHRHQLRSTSRRIDCQRLISRRIRTNLGITVDSFTGAPITATAAGTYQFVWRGFNA